MSLTVRLKSVKCVEELNEFSASEEPYVLMTSVSLRSSLPVAAPNFRTFLYGPWEDVDAGETIPVSGPAFWGLESTPQQIANPDEVIFVASLLENDNADPGQYRNFVLQAAAASLISTAGNPTQVVKAKRLVEDIAGALDGVNFPFPFALDDDHIGTREFRLDPSDLPPFGTKERSLTIESDEGHYELIFQISRSVAFARPGGAVAMARQTGDVLTALLVDLDGHLDVAWVVGTGAWQGPARISRPAFPPGGGVAMAKQAADLLTGLSVDREGFLNVAWVVGTGAWQGPVRISGPAFPAGAAVAMAKQADDLLTALAVDKDGFLNVAWVVGTGAWQGPVRIP